MEGQQTLEDGALAGAFTRSSGFLHMQLGASFDVYALRMAGQPADCQWKVDD